MPGGERGTVRPMLYGLAGLLEPWTNLQQCRKDLTRNIICLLQIVALLAGCYVNFPTCRCVTLYLYIVGVILLLPQNKMAALIWGVIGFFLSVAVIAFAGFQIHRWTLSARINPNEEVLVGYDVSPQLPFHVKLQYCQMLNFSFFPQILSRTTVPMPQENRLVVYLEMLKVHKRQRSNRDVLGKLSMLYQGLPSGDRKCYTPFYI